MTTGFKIDNIVKWVVRRPGETSWSDSLTEEVAHDSCAEANRFCQPGHQVYALHEGGE